MANAARNSKESLPQFTGLRGLAALIVLFYHIRSLQDQELTFSVVDAFSRFGELGVDVFFVLSGFILSVVYEKSFSACINWDGLHKYGWARFSRIYPLHFVMLFLMFGAYAGRCASASRQEWIADTVSSP
jgi:peptidoglycan/LPS O-acetylase OafA/YrhL